MVRADYTQLPQGSVAVLAAFCVLFVGCIILFNSDRIGETASTLTGWGMVIAFFGVFGMTGSLLPTPKDYCEHMVEAELKREMCKPLQSTGS